MPKAGTRPAPTDQPPASGAAIEAAVADIESQFASYLPHPERVAAACDILRREVAAAPAVSQPAWLARLLPLLAKRTGAIVVPLFEWMEERAADVPDAWPLLDAMLGAQDGTLQRRALRAIARAVGEQRVVVGPAIIETLAEATERDGSGLATEDGLREIGRIIGPASPDSENPALRLLTSAGTGGVQRLAARVLDLDGTPPSDEVVRRMLGDGPAALLAPYLAFTRATHMDLVALLPAARSPAVLESIRRTAAALGERAMCDVVAALGWPRLNLGIEAREVVGVSLPDSFPLLLSEDEASLIGGLPGARRVFERHLVVAAGGGAAGEEAEGSGGASPTPSPASAPTTSSTPTCSPKSSTWLRSRARGST